MGGFGNDPVGMMAGTSAGVAISTNNGEAAFNNETALGAHIPVGLRRARLLVGAANNLTTDFSNTGGDVTGFVGITTDRITPNLGVVTSLRLHGGHTYARSPLMIHDDGTVDNNPLVRASLDVTNLNPFALVIGIPPGLTAGAQVTHIFGEGNTIVTFNLGFAGDPIEAIRFLWR